ncbi:unnamed protein product, partial [Tetraodon nigroviridis]
VPPPPVPMMVPPPMVPPAAPPFDELIQQSQWNLQQQEQHLHTLRQDQVTAAVALAMEQQIQKLLVDTQLDITEFDSLLQPIIDTCTKDAISVRQRRRTRWAAGPAQTAEGFVSSHPESGVPIYCTSFLAVEEEKQQKITRLLQLWEKNSYFDEETIQQLQNPALGLGQYQASLITEYAAVVQPIQAAFQQQIQALKTQHQEFVSSLKQSQ